MKKVYMPSDETLEKMQKQVGSEYLYRYILTKAVESIVMNKSLDKNLLEGELKSIKKDYYIQKAICYLYPEQVAYSDFMQFESTLALELLERHPSNIIYNIDNIRHFDSMALYSNDIIKKVISILKQELPNMPTYRFEYKDNQLLDSIFECEIVKLIDYANIYTSKNDLIEIEPAYGILLPDNFFASQSERTISLQLGMINYNNRYGISSTVGSEYNNQDILNNPDANVKRLMKCIKKPR